MADDNYFVIERPGHKGRIKLGPEAKYWAKENGMTLAEMARYLLAQNSGDEQGAVEREEFLPDAPLSENIEDRRGEPIYGAGALKGIWGNTADVPPRAQTFGVNPLSAALGFRDVGRVPAPAPQVLGPYQPRPFIPEGF